ncbi:uncharacterized protein LOC135837297 [Planococcus citri]|uniref:uncharacterized protein LOC135837297 n=1 Tax=Planococcus citri TaxID=170843 RepID=UPI0031F8CCE0
MNYHTKLPLLIILLVLKELPSTQTASPSLTYDISKSLPNWIDRIFENVKDSNIDRALKNAFVSAKGYSIAGELKYNITDKRNSAVLLRSINIHYELDLYINPSDTAGNKPFILRTWRSSDKKIRISTERLMIVSKGGISEHEDTSHASYFAELQFQNFVLDATRVSHDPNDVKFSFEFSYNNSCVCNHEPRDDIDMIKKTKLMIPLALHEHMNSNPKFSEAIHQIVKIYYGPEEIISADPNFSDHRQQYYYFIPLIFFYGFGLRNVIIQGLLNIESLDVDKESSFFTQTLLMRNITGHMVLDYGSDEMAPLELNFLIDYFSISIQNANDLVHVEARSYSVNRTTNDDPLTYRQSANIIRKIECALAAGLMPSKRAWKTCHMESDIGQIEITNATDWDMIVKKYSDWIPFNSIDASKKLGFIRRIFQAAGGCFGSRC